MRTQIAVSLMVSILLTQMEAKKHAAPFRKDKVLTEEKLKQFALKSKIAHDKKMNGWSAVTNWGLKHGRKL